MKDFFKNLFIQLQPETIASKPLWLRAVTIFFSGAVCSIALPPYSLWPLFFIGFTTFYLTLRTAETQKRAFFFGWLFGLGYFLFGLNWIGNALLVEGNEFWWVWPLAVIALPIALSLFTGLATLLSYFLSFKIKAPLFATLCLFLTLAEYARGTLFTGFPWNLYGYIWSDNLTVAQSVSVIGPYGLTFLTLMWAALPISILMKRASIKTLWPILISLLAVLVFSSMQLKKPVTYHENFQIQIVQPNVAQKDKWENTKIGENFEKHIELSERQEGAQNVPTAIIWPETALHPILARSSAAQERLGNILQKHPEESFLLAGTLSSEASSNGTAQYFNNVSAFTQDKTQWPLYSKTHLVPFGEYIPFQEFIPLKTITQFSGFQRGSGPTTISLKGLPAFSPFICYETIFPHEVANKENRPDWLLNVTNDAWYGNSPGPYQHLAQSRMRAIEQGLPFVRAANTGISALMDPYGRTIASHGLQSQGLIISELPEATAPTIYSRYRELPFIIILFITSSFIGAAIISRRQS